MKKLFVSLLAVAGLAACATDDVVRELDNSTAIAFDSFVENATRADNVSINNDNITEFSVWGYMADPTGYVFNDELVWKSGDAWTYTNIQYWMPGNLYHFAAFAGSRENVVGLPEAMNANDLGTITFTNVAGKEDILFAEAHVESATGEQPVKFQFDHLLSKVKFTFKNGFANANNYIVITGIEMDVPKVGTVLLDQDADYAWTLGEGTTTLAFGDMNLAEKLEIGKAAGSDEELLTIPAGVDQKYAVRFHVAVYNGEKVGFESNKKVEITDINLLPGHSYNFVATINHENVSDDPTQELKPIEFTCAVDEWIEAETPSEQVKDAELRAAAQFGGEVTLENDVVLSAPLLVKNDLTINLNGHKISSASDVFEVAAGSLTIVGEGEIFAATDNGTPYCAVWAYGDAEVNIYGGDYKIGFPAGDYNDLIYAKGNAVINIYGGKFYNSGKENAFVLNLKDGSAADINVYGGAFEKFNPANNNSEGANTNFLADGYYSSKVGDYYVVADAHLVATAEDLQAALNEGIEDIRFAANIKGNVVVSQTEGVNYVIDGADYKFDGTLGICGNARSMGTETLTIKNVAFETAATSLDFISSVKAYVAAGQNYNYAHNVTIDGCTFTAAEGSGVVGIRGWQDFNLVVKNCVMNGGHSLAQITASSDTVFENCTINAGRGLNLLTSCVGLVVANCNITATEADGYGIRCDAGVASCLNLSGSTINAYEPVVLRNSTATFVFDVATTTLNATGDYQVVVKGEKPVMNGAEAYTCNM